jgi:peptidyl-prolyl cis-trans isomerase A (cyclophilin A)
LLVVGCAGEQSSGGGGDDDDGGAGGSGASGGAGTTGGGGPGSGGSGTCGPDVPDQPTVVGQGSDPEAGQFTMDEALAGLPEGPGPLRAVFETDLGVVTCELFPEVAPNGVANFVGLARGKRAWKSGADWVKRPLYDGLIFHRVIDDFMAQSGDPLGTGLGNPGYSIPDEIGALMHQPGTLAYANSGPNTNGSQFYITEVATDWLDGGYTILGQCEPMDVIQAITAVPTDANDKPLTQLNLVKVSITRCAP